VVSVIVDMAEGMLRWGRCPCCHGDDFLNLENCQENLIVKTLL
jgi:hypothetical protein